MKKPLKFPWEDINNSTSCCTCDPVSTMAWLYADARFMLTYAADICGEEEFVWPCSGLNLNNYCWVCEHGLLPLHLVVEADAWASVCRLSPTDMWWARDQTWGIWFLHRYWNRNLFSKRLEQIIPMTAFGTPFKVEALLHLSLVDFCRLHGVISQKTDNHWESQILHWLSTWSMTLQSKD
jgi:hypothetical protein